MTFNDNCLVRYRPIEKCLPNDAAIAQLVGAEAQQFARLRDPGRRRQWLAARDVARELVRQALQLRSEPAIEIITRNERNLGVSPIVLVSGQRCEISLSISHTARGVLVAATADIATAVGADLCEDLPIKTGFLQAWFSPSEQLWIAGNNRRAATIWAIKEAVFKAASQGAPWNPREIEVSHHAGGFRCQYQGQPVSPATLRVEVIDGQIAAIACLADPIEIQSPQHDAQLPIALRLSATPALGVPHPSMPVLHV